MSMEPTITSQLMAQAIFILNNMLTFRYLTGGALSVLLFEHLTTLDREVELIWKSRGKSKWILKGAFAFNRYGNEAFLLFVAYFSSGVRTPSLTMCRNYMMSVVYLGTIAIEISQFVFLLRVYSLTEQRRSFLYMLSGGFVIAISLSHIFAIRTMIALHKGFVFVPPGINVCIIPSVPRDIVGILAPMCAFDIFIILLTLYNAFDRPRRSNTELINNLYKDGAKYFLGYAAIHLVDLVMATSGRKDKLFQVIYAFLVLSSVLLSRLHFRMEKFVNLDSSAPVYLSI